MHDPIGQGVVALGVGRAVKDHAGERFQRDRLAAERVAVDHEFPVLHGNRLGSHQAAIGQQDGQRPAALGALAPINQLGRGNGPLPAAAAQGELPIGIRRLDLPAKPRAVGENRQSAFCRRQDRRQHRQRELAAENQRHWPT